MAEDPYDPQPENNWSKIVIFLAIIAAIIIGVWVWAGSLLTKSFQ